MNEPDEGDVLHNVAIALTAIATQKEERRKAHEAAMVALTARASGGDTKACIDLAGRLYSGIGMKKDQAAGLKWYQRAGELGDNGAAVSAGTILQCGVSRTEALQWFRLAASRGSANAHLHIGHCFWEGKGVDEDVAAAYESFLAGAQLGDVGCCHMLAYFHEYGVGRPVDSVQVELWRGTARRLSDANDVLEAAQAAARAAAEGKPVPVSSHPILDYMPGWEARYTRAQQQVLENVRDRLDSRTTTLKDHSVVFHGEPNATNQFWVQPRLESGPGIYSGRLCKKGESVDAVAQAIWSGVSDDDRLIVCLVHFETYWRRAEHPNWLEADRAKSVRSVEARLLDRTIQLTIAQDGTLLMS